MYKRKAAARPLERRGRRCAPACRQHEIMSDLDLGQDHSRSHIRSHISSLAERRRLLQVLLLRAALADVEAGGARACACVCVYERGGECGRIGCVIGGEW